MARRTRVTQNLPITEKGARVNSKRISCSLQDGVCSGALDRDYTDPFPDPPESATIGRTHL